MGGFYRTGEGIRDAGYTANNGGQFKFNVTKELLLPENDYSLPNEDATFVLAQTLTADTNKNESTLTKLHEKAIKYNKDRWCNWITKDFQNLRIKNIKDLYCDKCKK